MSVMTRELPGGSAGAEAQLASGDPEASVTTSGSQQLTDRAAVILTPDQRVRVFISSTLEELAEERAAARRAIHRLHLVPVWYESGARPHPPRSMYRAYVDQSQVFVGIYWQRYGWVAPGMEVSGLQDEYQLAAGKPMLLYVKRPAPDTEPRLAAMLDGIRSAGSVSYRAFATARELERLLADDLALLLSESFAGATVSTETALQVGNIPLPVSSFIGRDQELEQTAAALRHARLVTLTGAGGVGKTRLAAQVAGRAAARFANGAWLCELAPIRDPVGVDDAVAAVFMLAAKAGQSTRQALVEFLRPKEMLLVLDNCEHVLEEAAALARELTRSCERLVILATSREALAIEGEQLVLVPPLGVPRDDATLAATIEADSVRLFTERAAAAKPGFQVTTENAAAVAEVVRRLDGIALAIELAAARVPAMTPAELARRLEHSFAVLAAGRRGAVEHHHQTLRAAIDWSFQLLAEPEGALLTRLAVFANGTTLDAVEAVCCGDGVETEAVFDLLASLVARSLVVAEAYGPETRYRLLETIRQYGEQCLDQYGQTEKWRARHASYYADLLSRAREHAREPGQEVFWAVQAEADQDNLLAAWSWAIASKNVGTAFSILAGFAPAEIRSSYPLLLAGEVALGLPGAAEHVGYPLALAVSAVFAAMRADVVGAEELSRKAAAANTGRDPTDWRVDEIICLAHQNIATTRGDFAKAAGLAQQAAGIAQASSDLADASVELSIAAADHILAGDARGGLPLAREALALARQVGAPSLIATAVLGVGAAVAETDPDQARACLRESRELSIALGYQQARDLIWATGIAFILHDRTTALELGRKAISGLQRWSDRPRMGITLHFIAGTLAAIRPEAAAIILGAAESFVVPSMGMMQLVSSAVTAALDDDQARDLRARGAEMDWDHAIAYTLSQTTQALGEMKSE